MQAGNATDCVIPALWHSRISKTIKRVKGLWFPGGGGEGRLRRQNTEGVLS